MASAIYPLAKQSFLSENPSIDMDTDTIKVRLVRTSAYTYSAAHQFLSSLPAAIGTDQTLASRTVTNGVFGAANATFTAVAAGAAIDALALYKDTGNAATSPLICYMDGFSVTPNGGDITVAWNASGIFAL
jgi:hypothetical protein